MEESLAVSSNEKPSFCRQKSIELKPTTDEPKTNQNDQTSRSSVRSLSRSSSSSDWSSSISICQVNEDDLSSVDENNLQLTEVDDDDDYIFGSVQLVSSNDGLDVRPKQEPSLLECQICLEFSLLRPSSCCLSNVCPKCLFSHLSTNINEARIRVPCPSCSHIFSRDEIIDALTETDTDGTLTERYKRFYADINGEANVKTCPNCCCIKQFDKKLFEGIRWKKNAPRRVTCDECQFTWCFFCHAPWHEKMTCKEYQHGEKLLKAWASQKDQNQQNAQKCPRCKIFISRNGGCPHMVCSKCHCDFCYNCGKRRFGIKFLGSHESRFSPFGCKYNLYPDKPVLRHTVRGLVAGAVTLAAPVAAVGAVALLAVGTTIGAPTYGTYRLVKHIRNRRRNRRFICPPTRATSENPNNSDDDDDFNRAIQASMQTYLQELGKQEEKTSISDWNEKDDDDDSFDD